MSSLGQYAWSPRASLETEDGSVRPVEANRTEEVLGLDLGPGSSQGSSSTRSSSLPPPPNLPTRRSFSRPQTRRGFLFGNHAVDSMGKDSSSSDLQKVGKGSGHGRFARMIAASRLRRRVSPTRRHASPVRRHECSTGRRGSSMRALSSATRTYAGDDDDWETVDNGRPVACRNMAFKVAGGSSIADISDYGSLSQSRQSESFSPRQRLPQANYSENWSIMAEEHTGRTILVSGSRMGITDVVPITPTSQRHPRYHHPMPLPGNHIHPFNSSPPIISPNTSPSLPKSSSFVPSNYEDYSPIFSDDDNFPDRLSTMRSNLNVTGTPNGTGARLVGSSLANFSSPGFETSPLSRWPSSPPEENISHHTRISSQDWEDTLSSSESPTVRRNPNYCTIGMDPQMRYSISQKSLPPLPDELVAPEGTVLNIGNHKSTSSTSSSGFSPTFVAEDLAMRFPHLLAIDFESPNLNVFRPMPPSPPEERHERMKRMRSNNNLIAAGINNNGPEAVVADRLQISRFDPADTSNHDTVAILDSVNISHVNSTRAPEFDAAQQLVAADSLQFSRVDPADTSNHNSVATLHSVNISHVNSTRAPEFDAAQQLVAADSLQFSRVDPADTSNHDTVATLDGVEISHINSTPTPEFDAAQQSVAADSLQISRADPADTSNHVTVATLDNVEIPHIDSTRTPEIHAAQQQGSANFPDPSSPHLPHGRVRTYGDHVANILADIRSPMERPVPSDRTPRRQARMPTLVEGSPHLRARARLSSSGLQSRQIFLSRAWLLAFIIPFPMLIIMGHGMLDGLIEWQTFGEITHFRKQEKIVALGLGYGITLVLVIVVVVWWVAEH